MWRKNGFGTLELYPEENHTGVTVIVPGPDNAFANHYTAAAYVHNGFGKSAGTICYGMKGGIESASRVICIGEKEYTIGVLVQSNFGATEDFVLNVEAVGPKILEWKQ